MVGSDQRAVGESVGGMTDDLKQMLIVFINTLAAELRTHVPYERVGKPAQGVLDMLPAINDERFENIENEEG